MGRYPGTGQIYMRRSRQRVNGQPGARAAEGGDRGGSAGRPGRADARMPVAGA